MNIKELFTTKPSETDCPMRTWICAGIFVLLLVVMFVPGNDVDAHPAVVIQ
jgi:hypothetical protein